MSDADPGAIGSTAPGHYGVAASQVTLAQATIVAAWNVQGDPARAPFVAQVQRLFEVALPVVPNTTARGVAWTALWLGPRSWLMVARTELAVQPGLAAFTAQRDALNEGGGALFDLSASRVAFVVGGERAADVLAKACPLDFRLREFAAAHCAQSLFGHVNALLHRPDASPAFTLMVARSFARDVWRSLCLSAAQYGYDVVPSPHDPCGLS